MVDQVQENSIGASTDKIREGAKELKQAVTDTAKQKYDEYSETAKKKYDEYKDTAKDAVSKYSNQATEYVQENPMTSLAIAFGVGALIGMVMFRRD